VISWGSDREAISPENLFLEVFPDFGRANHYAKMMPIKGRAFSGEGCQGKDQEKKGAPGSVCPSGSTETRRVVGSNCFFQTRIGSKRKKIWYNSIMVRLFGLILVVGLAVFLDSQTSSEKLFTARREKMTKEQIITKGITDPFIVAAFLKVKRHLFVIPELYSVAYEDRTLPIADGQEINRPYDVALMTSIIASRGAKRVLEIGTGSGYQAALLAEVTGEVFTIEFHAELADTAKKRLQLMGYRNIRFKVGDGKIGWAEFAPFDGIIVTCSPEDIPQPLIDQLAKGGRMVIPITYSLLVQELVMVEKDTKGKLKKRNLIPVSISPMIRGDHGN